MTYKVPQTRLELLMRLTDVTGKEVSNSLHIDMSLISRWKNGNRRIHNEAYLTDLSIFFYRYKEGSYVSMYQTLTNNDDVREKPMVKAIGKWLGEPVLAADFLALEGMKARSINQTYLNSYEGNAGRRKGVLEFLGTAIATDLHGRIWLISQEDMTWLTEEPAFLHQWTEAMMQCIELGYDITIIHSIRRSMNELYEAFIQWVPFYMTGKVHAYYLNERQINLPVQTLFIIEDMLLCEGNVFSGVETDRYTMLTNDVITIQNRQKIYQTLFKKAVQLNVIYQKEGMPQIVNDIIAAGTNKEDSLFKAEELFFTNMQEDLLMEILKANKVTYAVQAYCLGFYHRLTGNFQQNVSMFTNRHIYNLNTLIEQAEAESFKAVLLSIVAGQEIIITRSQFVRHLQATIERLEGYANYEIGLYLKQSTQLPLEDMDFWVKEGYYLSMWSKRSYDFIQISTEPTMIEITKRFYRQLWEMIPLVDKDKEHVIEHLKKIIVVAENSAVKQVSNRQ